LKTVEIEPAEIEPGELEPRELEPRELKPGELEPGELKPGEVIHSLPVDNRKPKASICNGFTQTQAHSRLLIMGLQTGCRWHNLYRRRFRSHRLC